MSSPSRLRLLALSLLLLPASLLQAREGALLSVELVETLSTPAIDREVGRLFGSMRAPSARYEVDCFLVRFQSRYPDGEPATITAQVFQPRLAQGSPRLAYLFAPGTTGLLDACRPSREHIAGIHWGLYRAHVLAFAGQGALGVLPDYMGFGDAGHLQPIYNAVAEGRMMLDAVRALHRFLERREREGSGRTPRRTAKPSVFVAGFSQGGHAVFAAADLRRQYAPEVRLAGVIGYGPTTDLEALFREFPVVAPMAIYSFSQIYGTERFDPQKILRDRWAEDLAADVTRQCVGGMQSYYPWSARELFRPEFAEALLADRLDASYPEIYRILRLHSTGLSGHRLPCLILQGGDDVVVTRSSQERFVRKLCQARSPVVYRFYQDSRHDTRQIGFFEALSWMERLADGQPPESSCRELLAGQSEPSSDARTAAISPSIPNDPKEPAAR